MSVTQNAVMSAEPSGLSQPGVVLAHPSAEYRSDACSLLESADMRCLCVASHHELSAIDSYSCLMVSSALLRELSPENFLRALSTGAYRPAAVLLAKRHEVALSVKAMKSGFADVLLESDPRSLPDEVPTDRCRGICQCHDRGSPLPLPLQSLIDEDPQRRLAWRERNATYQALSQLTPRQYQVAAAVAEGQTNAVIAATMGISRKTVEAHRIGAMRRLGVLSRVELVRVFLQVEMAGH